VNPKLVVTPFLQNVEKIEEGLAELRRVAGGDITGAFHYSSKQGFDEAEQMEESSYSTYLSRYSRYLAEVTSACYAYGLAFEITGTDNHEGYLCYRNRDGWQSVQIQSAFTPATISCVIADVLSDALASVLNVDKGVRTPVYFVQVVIENGAFNNALSGIRIADNVQQMAQFLEDYPNIKIDIVPAYD
jgi:hypothetical protein